MKYRREIDGLRALAVLPVIFYHAGFQSFSGGFVGVDVFFVISGYLITTIILAEKQSGKFTLAGFYERRARRILPALFVVMAACVALAWFYFLPEQMKVFGQGITASAAFNANIYSYLKDDDYFGLQSESNPILHLWSLALEEQYYVLFPMLLMVFWGWGRRSVFSIVAVIAFASLAATHWTSSHNPTANFYLLPTRAWELLLGSLIAFVLFERADVKVSRAIKEGLGLAGLMLIVVAVYAFDRTTPFPSIYALLPTIGTGLVIVFATGETLAGKFLGSKLPVGIGLISYSAYLWHQPLFAFNRSLIADEPSRVTILILSAASLGLAYFTWRFVEVPFRDKRRFSRKAIFVASAAISGAFILFGIAGHYNNGYPNRDLLFGRLASNFGLSMACNGNYSVNETCATSANPEVAIFGNSFAMHLVEGFKDSHPGVSFVQVTQDSCEPHFGEQRQSPGKLSCPEFYERSLAMMTGTPSIRTVILSSPFTDLGKDENVVALGKTIERLRMAGKHVVVIGPTPAIGVDFGKCFLRKEKFGMTETCDFERNRIPAAHTNIIGKLRTLSEKHGADFYDLTEYICDASLCRTAVGDVFIYRDTGHLSREGSRYLFKKLEIRLASTPED